MAEGSQCYGIWSRFNTGPALNISLEGERSEHATGVEPVNGTLALQRSMHEKVLQRMHDMCTNQFWRRMV